MTRSEITRRSHWLGEALGSDQGPAPALDRDISADVCIVGGGFTGLWTALRLKEQSPGLDVVLIEKDVCGAGASGRNGGFVLSWWAKLLSLKKICGEAEAMRLAKASADAVAEIGRFCDENEIACGFRKDGWLWAATSAAQVGVWEATLEAAERFQAKPFVRWSPDRVAAASGSERHLAGVFEPSAATVQPAALARGLRRVALAKGVRIFEDTPLQRLRRDRPSRVETPRGTVKADKIVLATNAWSIAFPEIRRAILVVGSDIVSTAPIPERLKQIGWADGMAISDSRTLVHYYRTTPDGRIAFGKGGMSGAMPFGGRVGGRFDGASPIAGKVENWFKWTYPALKDLEIERAWTGPIDRSKDGLPLFGALPGAPDVFYAVGYSGNGVGPSALGGRILASLVLEAQDEWSGCGLVRPLQRAFPPEPLRYVGGRIVCRAVGAKDRAEDSGRKVGRMTGYLASFAPAGLSPLKGQNSGLSS
ncbi:MAG: FAD-binding oxidoreductase [Rhodospirillales bacterium]